MEAKVMLEKITGILEDKKARDVSVIDIREISVLSDYFVVCSGSSTTHIKALADELEEKMKENGLDYFHREGYDSARWILMDYGEAIVHIFHEEDRQFYNIERLWADGIVTYAGRKQ